MPEPSFRSLGRTYGIRADTAAAANETRTSTVANKTFRFRRESAYPANNSIMNLEIQYKGIKEDG